MAKQYVARKTDLDQAIASRFLTTAADNGQSYRIIVLSNGTVKAIPSGISPPTPATGLSGVVKLSSVVLSWGAASGSGIKYAVLRNGVELAQTTALTYKDINIVQGQTYNYTIQTVDQYGQRATATAPFSAFINPALNQAPTASVKTWPPIASGVPTSGKLKVRIDAADPDGQSMLFALTADGGTLTPDPGPDNDPTVWWYSP